MRTQVSLYRRPLSTVLAALVSSLVILSCSDLLLGFIASFILVCVLPGLALTHLLHEKLGPLDAIEEAIISIGTGYVLLIIVALSLDYLPISFSSGYTLLSFNLLIASFVGLRLRSRDRHEKAAPKIPRNAIYAILLMAAVAFALRFISLGYSQFVGDEAKVLLWAAEVIRGRSDAIFLYRKGPAEIVVSAVFYALLGRTNELVARLPFTIANFVAMLTIFQLGRVMFGLPVGLASGLLAAIEGFFVGLARTAQYQSFVLLLGCLSILLFYRFYRGSIKASPFLGVVTVAVGFLCHWDMVFIVPVVGYLSYEAVRRHGKSVWDNRTWFISAALLAAILLASFYLPFLRNPRSTETFSYLSKIVRASRFPYFHLPKFIEYGTTYNSIYYSVLISLTVLLEVAYITRRSFVRTWLSTPLRLGILVVVPAGLFIGLGTDHLARVALLACVSLMLIFVLLSRQRVETKGVFLWFFVSLICYLFIFKVMKIHIYNLSGAVSLLAGTALVRASGLLASSGRRRVAIAGIALWYVVSANYIWMAFVQTDPEYIHDYPLHRDPAYWAPYGDALPRVDTYGFPYDAGWEVVGSLYYSRALEGDYDSNEKERTTRWYTRGAVRCKYDPQYYILAENAWDEDEQPVPLDIIADEYQLIGVISARGRPQLRVYERSPVVQQEVTHYQLEDWIPVFDGEVVGPHFFTGVPRVDPEASIPHLLNIRFGDYVRVLGYGLARPRFQPGDHVTLTVYWQMLEPLASGHRIFFHLGKAGDRWGQRDIQPGCGLLSDDDWIPGRVVIDRYDLRIDPATPPGWYPLRTGMYRLEATISERLKVPLFDQYDNPIPREDVFLTKLQVGEPGIEGEIRYPLDFSLGDGITLLGYDLAANKISPESALGLTLYWQARERMSASYTVFTHLVDENDHIQGQWDGIPDGGRNPTNEWVPGEIIVDRYEMPVSADSELGQYGLRVGMYDATTGERLPVRDAVGNLLSGDYIPLHPTDIRSG
jgi:4-amino-4-deoxy-L-arabinose transferase-like glycosyltransferase